jgi:mRNA-degrading endonuclease RelE of RelBE toxin-antitoxin system
MRIIITDPFGRKLRKLRKKYPNIKNDLRELLSDMEHGNMPGVPMPGLYGKVFKVRLALSDMRKGKSGGYRVICYAESEDSEIYLLTIYAKAKNETIPVTDIQAIAKQKSGKYTNPGLDKQLFATMY